jgi:tetratricopeptide (TPR) repeat protein
MMPVFARYLGLIFWPAHLSPIYGPPIKTTADLEVVLSAALFVTVLAAGLYLLYRRRLAGFCLTFFLLGLLPVSHIFPLPTLMQDRYLYFPLLGFSLCAVAWAADAASGRFGAKGANFACSVALILALLLAYVSYGQAAVWNNAESLWSHAVKVVPRSWQAWNMLAATRHDLKDFAGAEDAYLHLLAISPREKLGLVGIGTLYGERGDIEKSLHYLRQAVDIAPDDPDVLVNFGFAQFLNGDLEACRTSFQRAVVINPQLIGKLLPTLLEVASRQNDQEEVLRLKSLIKRGQANFMN